MTLRQAQGAANQIRNPKGGADARQRRDPAVGVRWRWRLWSERSSQLASDLIRWNVSCRLDSGEGGSGEILLWRFWDRRLAHFGKFRMEGHRREVQAPHHER